MKVYYKDEYVNELVCEVMTNHSMTVDEALDLCDVDMDEFASDKGWEDWDPNALVAVWEEETKEVYIVISNDPDAEFDDLEEAKNYMIPDVDFDDEDYNEYIEELKNADTLEELAHIWNTNTDRFNDGSSFDVKER